MYIAVADAGKGKIVEKEVLISWLFSKFCQQNIYPILIFESEMVMTITSSQNIPLPPTPQIN
jgi:hypothetical protein